MLKRIINHFFSFSCPGCKIEDSGFGIRGSKFGDSGFCQKCTERLDVVFSPLCPSCGGTLDGVLEVCSKCLKEDDTPWDLAIAVLNMQGFSRELIQRFKYKNDTSLMRPLASLAANALEKYELDFDLIMPIPLHWFRRFMRGYNQSALLAKQISKITKTKYKNLLFRKKYTPPQTKLSGDQRRKNLKGVFGVCNRKYIEGKTILLVDDVFTTGSRLRAASKVLLENSAKSVSILVLSRR